MTMQFGMRDCEFCMHKAVCKHKDLMDKIVERNLLPIDFSTTTCLEYTPDNLADEVFDASDPVLEIRYEDSTFVEMLEHALDSFHTTPDEIVISADIEDQVREELELNEDEEMHLHGIPIRVRENMPTENIEFIYLKPEDKEEE
ncbi:hypothetical protein D3C77_621370 [compost metagenome]